MSVLFIYLFIYSLLYWIVGGNRSNFSTARFLRRGTIVFMVANSTIINLGVQGRINQTIVTGTP